MKELPFFSIIIPTYNRAELLIKTIRSVLNQHFEDFEIIIVDDGGTDDTEGLVKEITDPRLRYFKKVNGERGAARNFGIDKALGNYVTFIDSDDLLYAHAFTNAYDQLNSLSMPVFYAQAFEVVDINTGQQLQKPAAFTSQVVNEEIIKGNFLGCIGVFVKNTVLKEIGFEEDRMFAGTEDWLLWLQLAARYPLYFSGVVCACMIEHESRSVLSFSEEKLRYRTDHLKKVLSEDVIFAAKFGTQSVNKVYAHMLSYTSLHLAMSGKTLSAVKYLVSAFGASYLEIFKRRTLGILKTMLLKNFKKARLNAV